MARLLAGCDLLVSERLHAIVIGAVLGVPALVLAYDVKVLELATMLGLESSTIDINSPFDAAEVTDGLADLVARHAEVRQALLGRSRVLGGAGGCELRRGAELDRAGHRAAPSPSRPAPHGHLSR